MQWLVTIPVKVTIPQERFYVWLMKWVTIEVFYIPLICLEGSQLNIQIDNGVLELLEADDWNEIKIL